MFKCPSKRSIVPQFRHRASLRLYLDLVENTTLFSRIDDPIIFHVSFITVTINLTAAVLFAGDQFANGYFLPTVRIHNKKRGLIEPYKI